MFLEDKWNTRRRFLWGHMWRRSNFYALAKLRLEEFAYRALRVLMVLLLLLLWPSVVALWVWLQPARAAALLAKALTWFLYLGDCLLEGASWIAVPQYF